jgi:hypothetical protein
MPSIAPERIASRHASSRQDFSRNESPTCTSDVFPALLHQIPPKGPSSRRECRPAVLSADIKNRISDAPPPFAEKYLVFANDSPSKGINE